MLAEEAAQSLSRQVGIPQHRPQRPLRYILPGVHGHGGGAAVGMLEPVMTAADAGRRALANHDGRVAAAAVVALIM
jgi:hypothetical protein